MYIGHSYTQPNPTQLTDSERVKFKVLIEKKLNATGMLDTFIKAEELEDTNNDRHSLSLPPGGRRQSAEGGATPKVDLVTNTCLSLTNSCLTCIPAELTMAEAIINAMNPNKIIKAQEEVNIFYAMDLDEIITAWGILGRRFLSHVTSRHLASGDREMCACAPIICDVSRLG